MTLSEFRKKKLLFVFHTFFDADKSGSIDKKDFQVAAERICRVRGWEIGSAQGIEVLGKLTKIWDELSTSGVDENNDNEISEDEWCQMWEKYEGGQGPDWQHKYRDLVFSVHDTSGDGTMDEEEFTKVCTRYGVSQEDCVKAYAKFSQNKTITVNKDVFAKLWQEYFTSEDANAPGNFIFGKTSF